MRHVKAHVAVNAKKNKIWTQFNTKGHVKQTDEVAKNGADLDKGNRAEWLASEIRDKRD